MTICVFGASRDDPDPGFFRLGEALGEAMARRGHAMIFGGGAHGLMGAAARGCARGGGTVIGVAPRFFDMPGVLFEQSDEMVLTGTMSERKELMREGCSLAVALPGGIGTLDELIETLVLVKLGRLDCRIAAVNVDGFYDPLKALLDHYVATNMLEPADRALISFPSTVEEFEALL